MTTTTASPTATGRHGAAQTPAVTMTGLTKTFGTVTAVDGLSLQVQPGEVVAFLGPNGAGKTTTIDMLLGLARPDAGTVGVFGGTPDRRRRAAAGSPP